VFEE
jgi:hypothetical protein